MTFGLTLLAKVCQILGELSILLAIVFLLYFIDKRRVMFQIEEKGEVNILTVLRIIASIVIILSIVTLRLARISAQLTDAKNSYREQVAYNMSDLEFIAIYLGVPFVDIFYLTALMQRFYNFYVMRNRRKPNPYRCLDVRFD